MRGGRGNPSASISAPVLRWQRAFSFCSLRAVRLVWCPSQVFQYLFSATEMSHLSSTSRRWALSFQSPTDPARPCSKRTWTRITTRCWQRVSPVFCSVPWCSLGVPVRCRSSTGPTTLCGQAGYSAATDCRFIATIHVSTASPMPLPPVHFTTETTRFWPPAPPILFVEIKPNSGRQGLMNRWLTNWQRVG